MICVNRNRRWIDEKIAVELIYRTI